MPDRAAFGRLVRGKVAVNVCEYLRAIQWLQLPHRLDKDAYAALVITRSYKGSVHDGNFKIPYQTEGDLLRLFWREIA